MGILLLVPCQGALSVAPPGVQEPDRAVRPPLTTICLSKYGVLQMHSICVHFATTFVKALKCAYRCTEMLTGLKPHVYCKEHSFASISLQYNLELQFHPVYVARCVMGALYPAVHASIPDGTAAEVSS